MVVYVSLEAMDFICEPVEQNQLKENEQTKALAKR